MQWIMYQKQKQFLVCRRLFATKLG
uniref:Uncharacterized protein n=1 Tax=Rhizophora mucronata TaxID=61149 RepID=A0A2P2P504_RHIMU